MEGATVGAPALVNLVNALVYLINTTQRQSAYIEALEAHVEESSGSSKDEEAVPLPAEEGNQEWEGIKAPVSPEEE